MRTLLLFLVIPTQAFSPQRPFASRRSFSFKPRYEKLDATESTPAEPPQSESKLIVREEKSTLEASAAIILSVPKNLLAPLVQREIKKDVPKETLGGAIVFAAISSYILTIDFAIAAFAGTIGGYIAVHPGALGDVTRATGDAMVKVGEFANTIIEDGKKVLAELAELAEEERLAKQKAEEERLAAEEERIERERIAAKEREEREKAAFLAEQLRLAAERERIEAEKKAEEERLAAAKKAEEERVAAEKAAAAKKAEEEKVAAEKAAAAKKAEVDRNILPKRRRGANK